MAIAERKYRVGCADRYKSWTRPIHNGGARPVDEHSENCIVGISGSFIDRWWRPRRLALVAEVKNDVHDSKEEVALVDKQLKTKYNLDVSKVVRYTISDTAAAARKVSRQFDTTLWTDCMMHAPNLWIGYGIGLKENLRNEYQQYPKTKFRPDGSGHATRIRASSCGVSIGNHAFVHHGLHTNDEQENAGTGSASNSTFGECSRSSDTEIDLLYGDEVFELAEETSADSLMNAKADAALEE
ncbi:hypothetical protein ON010_g14669 [Phytophthora cinnamomi]|nr:hypothetical protein ON010_g14669 [Phytophthora cinnamomi]